MLRVGCLRRLSQSDPPSRAGVCSSPTMVPRAGDARVRSREAGCRGSGAGEGGVARARRSCCGISEATSPCFSRCTGFALRFMCARAGTRARTHPGTRVSPTAAPLHATQLVDFSVRNGELQFLPPSSINQLRYCVTYGGLMVGIDRLNVPAIDTFSLGDLWGGRRGYQDIFHFCCSVIL